MITNELSLHYVAVRYGLLEPPPKVPRKVQRWARNGLVAMIETFIPREIDTEPMTCCLCGRSTLARIPLLPHEAREFRKAFRRKPTPDDGRPVCDRHRLEPWKGVGGFSATFIGGWWRHQLRGFAGTPIATEEQRRASVAAVAKQLGDDGEL